MRILVAGGAGYIGSKLIPVLLEHGYKIDVVDLLWFGNHLPQNVSVVKKDLFKCQPEDLKDYDQVIFLAGLSNDPMAEFDPSMNFIFNGALPSYTAYIAKKAGVKRFIYASSCSVYGYTVNELYDENSPVTCGYPYGISKLQGERGVLQLQDEGFSVIALRQGTICGYSPRMRLDLIVNTMFKFAMADRKITINNPSIWRPILDIRDAATAELKLKQLANLHALQRYVVEMDLVMDATTVQLEEGDYIKINHALLPAAISNSAAFVIVDWTEIPATQTYHIVCQETPWGP